LVTFEEKLLIFHIKNAEFCFERNLISGSCEKEMVFPSVISVYFWSLSPWWWMDQIHTYDRWRITRYLSQNM